MHPLLKPGLMVLGFVTITLFVVFATDAAGQDEIASYDQGQPTMFGTYNRVNPEYIEAIEENDYTCDNGLRTEIYVNGNTKIYCSNATYNLKLHIDNEKCSHYHNPGFPPGCKSAWYTVKKSWFKGF